MGTGWLEATKVWERGGTVGGGNRSAAEDIVGFLLRKVVGAKSL
jgi:hypothetical protein